jgi:type IV secretory pathway VirB9-like protein
MAAAAINHLRELPHKLRKRESSDDSAKDQQKPQYNSPEAQQQHEEEKRQILSWENEKHALRPEDIVKRGEDKHVGFSSERLRCDDFDLLKTLGTGE